MSDTELDRLEGTDGRATETSDGLSEQPGVQQPADDHDGADPATSADVSRAIPAEDPAPAPTEMSIEAEGVLTEDVPAVEAGTTAPTSDAPAIVEIGPEASGDGAGAGAAIADAPEEDEAEELYEDLERVIPPNERPGDWFVIHTYAGYENKVKANLLSRISSMNAEESIFEVVIPMEDVMEIKQGKK
ncbi:MAG: hypothetical protein M3P18_03605, partial [Actinomycetota bacterium]|nr:hypothetical protein [Actinomycetota bacterium]